MGTRWRGAKDFRSAYSDGQELLSLIRFTLVNVKTHLIIEVEADSYHAAKKKNVMLGQAKIDDCDNDDDYYHQLWEGDNNGKRRRYGAERREKRNDLGHRHQW